VTAPAGCCVTLPLFGPTLAERFDAFHADNPHVYDTLVRLAREWLDVTGLPRLGIKMLFERARWEIAIATQATDFKLNNDYTAFYARLLMAREPDLAGLFELRRSAADQLFGRSA
jgi:hypothetical protein